MAIELRQRLRRQRRVGRQGRADAQGVPRGRSVHGPSLIIAYSHCIAHGIDMRRARPAEAGGRAGTGRSSATTRGARGGREPVPARLAAPAHPAERLRLQRDALSRAGERRPRRGRAAARARRGGRRAALGCATRRWPPAARSSFPADARKDRLMDLDDRLPGPRRCATRWSRRPRRCRRPSTASGGWRTPASARSCCTRCSRSSSPRGSARTRARRRRHRELRRGAVLLPRRRRGGARPAPVPEPARARRGRRRRPGDRQPQRRHARRLDRLRAGDPGGRRRRARAEHLLPARRPAASPAATSSSATSTSCARVKDAVTMPVAVKLSPYFSSTGEMALRLDEAGADGAGAVQPLPPARHRPRDARGRARRRPVQPGGGAAAAHVDRAPARTRARLARGDDRRRGRRPTSPSTCSPARTWS